VALKTSTVLFGAALALAVLAGGLTTALLGSINRTKPMVISTSYLAPWQAVTGKDVTIIHVPWNTPLSDTAQTLSQVVGHFLTVPIAAGYPVPLDNLGTAASYSGFLSEYVERSGVDGVLMAYPASSTLASLVQPGEQIALVAQVQVGNESQTKTYAPIRVLGVLRGSSGSAQSLLLFIPDAQYSVLAPIITSGNSQVVLIPQDGMYASPKVGQPLLAPLASSSLAVASGGSWASRTQILARASTVAGTVTVVRGTVANPVSNRAAGASIPRPAKRIDGKDGIVATRSTSKHIAKPTLVRQKGGALA